MARLGDVCKLVSGNSLPETIVAENGELPYVKVAELNLTENIPNITTSRQFVSVENISAKQIVPVGTVIFPKRGGAIGTNKKRLVSTPICMDLNLMGVIPSSKLCPQYLYYFFENIDMGALSNGSSVPQINNSDIAPLEIRIPDITTQKDIAIRLDKVTELIALRKGQLAKLDQLVKSRFIELFGDLASPECKWRKEKLVNACADPDDIKCGPFGTQLSKDEYRSDGVAVWEIPQINSRFSTIPTHYLSENKAKQLEAYSIKAGDIAMSRKGNVGKCAVFPSDFEAGIIHSDVLRIRVDSKHVLPVFMMHQLHYSGAVQHQIELVSSGAIMAGINVTKLKQILVHIPPLNLQTQFAAFVEQTDKSKLAIQQSLDKLDLLKKSLMQEYFG